MKKKALFGLILLFLAFPTEGKAEKELVFPHVTNGGEYRMSFLLRNTGESTENVSVECFSADSSSWALDFVVQGSYPLTTSVEKNSIGVTPLTFTLTGGGAVKLETVQSQGLQTGWCRVAALWGYSLEGHAVFVSPYGETTVTATDPTCGWSMFADITSGRTVGVAIANPNSRENRVLLSLRSGETGVVMTTTTVIVPGMGQRAFFLGEAFGASLPENFVGTVGIQPQDGFVSVLSVGWISRSDGAYSFNNAPANPDGAVCLPGGGPVVWNALSPEARGLIQTSTAKFSQNKLYRWDGNDPISVYAPADFSQNDVAEATESWEKLTEGKMSFRLATSTTTKGIEISPNWWENDIYAEYGSACAWGGPQKVQGGKILLGKVWFNLPVCQSLPVGDWERLMARTLAHEIGHALGFMAHTPMTTSFADVMGGWNPSIGYSLVSSLLLEEIFGWMYSVPPGTEVPLASAP